MDTLVEPLPSQSRYPRIFNLIFALLMVLSIGFYSVQNMGWLPGGGIALSKLLWLLSAIVIWFVLPTCLCFDQSLNKHSRLLIKVFTFNMWARGLIELFMMYVTVNWHPYYGISHDLFSVLLVAALSIYFKPSGWIRLLAVTWVWMLLVESYFAWYMLNNVHSSAPVYYVPQASQHQLVFTLTWCAVIATAASLLVIYRGWIRTA